MTHHLFREGNGTPLQYSCLENPMDGGGWKAVVHVITEGGSDTTERLHFYFLLSCIGEGNGNPLQYSCLENPRDRGAWWAAVHGVAKSRTRLRDFPFTFHFHALEKEMATHSSVLAWRIPGTREPGGLPSMGSHRVGHDWSNLAAAAWSNTSSFIWFNLIVTFVAKGVRTVTFFVGRKYTKVNLLLF